ncbi:terminase small subunit protein [Schlegelella sp. S2-27]|uniref:Terminase small subunit protein n=1 Tax=Caldimonas mangrovi TaxID=2944811 RepID=A0ABT0YW31_9BURK|nr:terminase small subunit protein [Caldimonas mangrovi]MCM5682504.1 terminase small subunit protein [Caldimonas mangrovi]
MARSKYTEEMAALICEEIASGKSLREICKQDGMPDKVTVLRWLDAHESFRTQYARAREAQAETIFEEILEIADDARNDWMEQHADDAQTAGWKFNGENVQRSRLRVDARKWFLGKVAPKKYGDKLDVEHSGKLTLGDLVAGSMKQDDEQPSS